MIPVVAIAAIAWALLRIVRMNAATRYWIWWAVLGVIAALLFRPAQHDAGTAGQAVPLEVTPTVNWFVWLVLAWMLFLTYRLLRIGISYLQLLRLRHRGHKVDDLRLDELREAYGVKRSALLLVSDQISSPVALGFLRPAVVLPKTLDSMLTREELDHVLLHELAHIARGDDWTNLAAKVFGAFLGWHPVIAFVLMRIEKERELACDDWVVATSGKARSYAASLAKLFELSQEMKQPVLATGIAGSRLGDRVEQLLAHGRQFTRDASIAAVIIMAAALMVLAIGAAQSPTWVAFAQEPPAPAVPPAAPEPPRAPTPAKAPVPRAAPTPPAAPAPPVAPTAPLILPQLIPPTPELLRDPTALLEVRKAELARAQAELVRMQETLRAQQQSLEMQKAELQRQIDQFQQAFKDDFQRAVENVKRAEQELLRENSKQ
jgi:beta-lactamase regulating signal transducer with metallopeptidase domain